jgi:hypothetical protein
MRAKAIGTQRECGCWRSVDGRWWHHAHLGYPEWALCEPFGGCSHRCAGPKRCIQQYEKLYGKRRTADALTKPNDTETP